MERRLRRYIYKEVEPIDHGAKPYLRIRGELTPIDIHSFDEIQNLMKKGRQLFIAVHHEVGEKVVTLKGKKSILQQGEGFEEVIVWAKKTSK